MHEMPAVYVEPESELLDEEQVITVKGLKKHQEITIHVRVAVGGGRYASSGCYRSNQYGVVDLSSDESLNGTYTACNMHEMPAVYVEPESELLDEEQVITVKGLKKHQEITIHVRVAVGGGRYASSGCYRSNQYGVVDLSSDESLNGTYTGLDVMGLFWSMKCEPGYEFRRFKTHDVTIPLLYDIYVYDGMFFLDEIQHCPKACLATLQIQRLCMKKSVELQEIKDGPIRGTLFIPKGSGPFPAVIYAIVETNLLRPALLASHGFLVFQLDIGRVHVLTDNWRDLKEIQKIVHWFTNHPLAVPGGIAAYGLSFGGFVLNHLSLLFKEIKAVVMVNSIPYGPIRPVYFNTSSKTPMSFEYDADNVIYTNEGAVLLNAFPLYEERFAESWKSHAKYLCIISGDDQCYDPNFMETWYHKWPSDQRHRLKFLRYPDAGHIVEPPFIPLTRVSYEGGLAGTYSVWGGKPKEHAYCQRNSWKHITEFLRTIICENQTLRSNL